MPGRQFKPGPRNPEHRLQAIHGKLSGNRHAWVRTVIGQFIIYRHNDDIPDEPKIGDTLQLMIPLPNRKPLTMNFSALTEEELRMIKEFFNLLFDLAEPVVKARDKVAQDAFAAGDDSYSRVYRQVPQYVVRERPVTTDGESIHDGSQDVLEGDGPDGGDGAGLRGDSDDLASAEPQDTRSQDDGQKVN